MPNNPSRVEIITGRERRRRYAADEKLALVDAIVGPGMGVSAVFGWPFVTRLALLKEDGFWPTRSPSILGTPLPQNQGIASRAG